MVVSDINKTRIGGSKVKTGCRTCKARRVKCDEAKPNCRRCVKAGRKCEGYSPSSEPVSVLVGHKFVHYIDPVIPILTRSPSSDVDFDVQALRALDFFHHSTALQLEQPFAVDLWSKALSCLMQSEPAVKHGVISLASLHENFIHPSKSSFEDQRKFLALEHYGKSIREVVRLNQKVATHATLTTLITCLLYCGIESMQGHFFSAMKHIVAGIHLLAEYEETLTMQEELGCGLTIGFVDALRRMFINLGTQAMGLDDNGLDQAAQQYLSIATEQTVGYSFDSTDQALADIAHLINDVMRFLSWGEKNNKEPDFPNAAYRDAALRLYQRYDAWSTMYNELLAKDDGALPEKHIALLILRINQIVLRIGLGLPFDFRQTAFDSYVDDFRLLIDTTEDLLDLERRQLAIKSGRNRSSEGAPEPGPSFSMTLGVIPALFFTCSRCRDSEIRHRALELLKTQRRRESVWDSRVVAVVAERLIDVEEQNALRYWKEQKCEPESASQCQLQAGVQHMDIKDVEDVPECARVAAVEIDFLELETSAQISLIELAGANKQHDHIIAWEE